MKLRKDVYLLCMDAYEKGYAPEVHETEDIQQKQEELLRILLERFSKELQKQSLQKNGLMRVKIQGGFFHEKEPGFKSLLELRNKNQLEQFLKEYCFYIGEVQELEDPSHRPFFEIIWDYKNYFEQSFAPEINNYNTRGLVSNKNLIKATRDFKELPVDYQADVLYDFIDSVEEHTARFQDEIIENSCQEEHEFGEWMKDVSNHSDIHWVRFCKKCGKMERVEEIPVELQASETPAQKAKKRNEMN